MSKNIFILGLGGSGSRIADLFAQGKCEENNRIISLAMDTNLDDLSSLSDNVYKLALTNVEQISSVIERIGIDEVSSWFPISNDNSNSKFINSINMHRGTNLWRLQGVLSFVDFILDDTKKGYLYNCIDRALENNENEISFYIVSSLCGGTGSAIFLIVSYFISDYIKEKYNKKIKFNLILTCPDIYAEVVTGKFRTKCFANAYAALQELNSVTLVANGYNEKAIKEHTGTIDFKLYLGSRVIFDASDLKYHTRDMLPINQVYLFDKLPTISNVKEYESIINTILHLITFGNEKLDCQDSNIYASIFATKVRYPYQVNIDYIVERKTLEDVKKQWLSISTYIEEIEKMDKLEKRDNIKVADSNFEYAANFIRILDKLEDIDNIDETLLKRICEIPNTYISIQYYTDDETNRNDIYFKKIRDNIFNKEYLIDSILIENLITSPEDIKNINIFDSKKIKQNKKQVIVDCVIEINNQLTKYYVSKLKEFYNYKLNFINLELLPDIKEYLSDNNEKKVHPVTAFLRLLRLYKDLVLHLSREPILSEKELNARGSRLLIPEKLYENIEFSKNLSNKYLNSGNDRFLKIIKGNIVILNNLKEDYTLIQNDALMVVKNIKQKICSYYMHTACELISKLIANYIQIFKKMKCIVPYCEEELKTKLNKGISDSIVCMNFGTSVEEKKLLYKEFTQTENYYEYDDSLAGEIVLDCALSASLDENININNITTHNIYHNLYEFNYQFISSNPVIQRIKAANLFDVLQNETIFDNTPNILKIKNSLSRVMGGTISPLVTKEMSDDYKEQPNYIGNIIFSSRLYKYVINNKDVYEITTSNEKRIIDEFLYKIDNTKHAFKVNDYLNDKEILVTNEISHMPLNWFAKLDEFSYDSLYYKCYKMALYDDILNSSELWNPYIFAKNNHYSLLYFNQMKQYTFESDYVKTLIWLLINNKIYLDVVDRKNKKSHLVYYSILNNENEPLLVDNQPIYEEEIDKLLTCLKFENEIVEKYSMQFNEYFEDLLSNIRIKSQTSKIFDIIENKIMKSKFIETLISNYYNYVSIVETNKKTNLLYLIYKANEKNLNNNDVVIILKVIINLIKQIINKYLSETEYDEKVLLRRIIKNIIEKTKDIITDVEELTNLEKLLKKISK